MLVNNNFFTSGKFYRKKILINVFLYSFVYGSLNLKKIFNYVSKAETNLFKTLMVYIKQIYR